MSAGEITIADARLRRLYDYWLGKKGARAAPSREDIAPQEIADVLPWVFIMERVGDRLRYRLVGDAFREIYGARLIGMFLDEIDLDHITAAYIGEYDIASRGPVAVARQWKFVKTDGRHLEYERLILPLSADGRAVDRFLCGAVGFGYG
ncbi:PAS domain-containing protein [Ferrovibrio xuzhouensis]|uniref:PAS domain-containing protein n=1 Tax=Ferrovibrio xuzhouensis TaxID=1576914 RepID=A0ABV7VF26_9PROT